MQRTGLLPWALSQNIYTLLNLSPSPRSAHNPPNTFQHKWQNSHSATTFKIDGFLQIPVYRIKRCTFSPKPSCPYSTGYAFLWALLEMAILVPFLPALSIFPTQSDWYTLNSELNLDLISTFIYLWSTLLLLKTWRFEGVREGETLVRFSNYISWFFLKKTISLFFKKNVVSLQYMDWTCSQWIHKNLNLLHSFLRQKRQ